jgi:hypothetical protein
MPRRKLTRVRYRRVGTSADALIGAEVDEHLCDPKIQPANLSLDRLGNPMALNDGQLRRHVDVEVDADASGLAPRADGVATAHA